MNEGLGRKIQQQHLQATQGTARGSYCTFSHIYAVLFGLLKEYQNTDLKCEQMSERRYAEAK